MTFLYKSKEGVVNLAGLVISATTGVELDERIDELDAEVGNLLTFVDLSPSLMEKVPEAEVIVEPVVKSIVKPVV